MKNEIDKNHGCRYNFCVSLHVPTGRNGKHHLATMRPLGKAPGLIGMKVFLELKLTPAQQEEMLTIVSRLEGEGEALHDEARRANRKLASVMRAEKFDEIALRQAYREVSSGREEIGCPRCYLSVQ